MMGRAIPSKIVRKIIFDILVERSNAIDDYCDELIKNEMAKFGVYGGYAGEVGWTACGTRVLADDILEGIMSLEEAVEVLSLEERQEAKARCQNWLDKILGYDCDGEEIEEYRILRFPFSDAIDNWEEAPKVEPRFYCAIKGNNNQAYLISVYDDYNRDAIKRYEKIAESGQIPTKIREIKEAKNYEVAVDGITNRGWYYDRDRKALKQKLQTLIKDMEKDEDEER